MGRLRRHQSRNTSRRVGESITDPIPLPFVLLDADDHAGTVEIGTRSSARTTSSGLSTMESRRGFFGAGIRSSNDQGCLRV